MDLSKCPRCGGEADNGHDRSYPPVPYYCSKCQGCGMKTIFDHLRDCAANGDMPTLDAEDAQRIVETYDELLAALRETLSEGIGWYDDSTGANPDRLEWVQRARAAIKRATESRPLQIERPSELPTFDEWHQSRYGESFEGRHMHPYARIDAAMRELARELRDYTTEMARAARTPQPADRASDQS